MVTQQNTPVSCNSVFVSKFQYKLLATILLLRDYYVPINMIFYFMYLKNCTVRCVGPQFTDKKPEDQILSNLYKVIQLVNMRVKIQTGVHVISDLRLLITSSQMTRWFSTVQITDTVRYVIMPPFFSNAASCDIPSTRTFHSPQVIYCENNHFESEI